MRTLLVHCVKTSPWYVVYDNHEHVSFIAQVKSTLKGFKLYDKLLEEAQNKFGDDTEILGFSEL